MASLVSGKGSGLALTVGKGQAQCLACLLIYSFNEHLCLRQGRHGPRKVNVPQDTNQGVEAMKLEWLVGMRLLWPVCQGEAPSVVSRQETLKVWGKLR